jgi:hypothetical protein
MAMRRNVPGGETASVFLLLLDDHSLGRLLVLHLLDLGLIRASPNDRLDADIQVGPEGSRWNRRLVSTSRRAIFGVSSHTIAAEAAGAAHNDTAGRAGVGRT